MASIQLKSALLKINLSKFLLFWRNISSASRGLISVVHKLRSSSAAKLHSLRPTCRKDSPFGEGGRFHPPLLKHYASALPGGRMEAGGCACEGNKLPGASTSSRTSPSLQKALRGFLKHFPLRKGEYSSTRFWPENAASRPYN